jgi:hypothetical protein
MSEKVTRNFPGMTRGLEPRTTSPGKSTITRQSQNDPDIRAVSMTDLAVTSVHRHDANRTSHFDTASITLLDCRTTSRTYGHFGSITGTISGAAVGGPFGGECTDGDIQLVSIL